MDKLKSLMEQINQFVAQYWVLVAGGAVILALVGVVALNRQGSDSDVETAGGEDIGASDGTDPGLALESPVPGGSGGSGTGGDSSDGGTVIRRGGNTITIPKSGGPPVADLFKTSEDRIGITKSEIRICIHAALSLASVFNVSEKSLNTYWSYVNDELGGIYGRKLVMSYTDDNYGNSPQDVRDAYEECKAGKPFLLLGGIGFDQIPQVRGWAEEDRYPYIHHIAREDLDKRFAFSYLPSVETVGTRSGQWVMSQYANKRLGVLWRNSEHWEPGHKTFKKVVQDKKGNLVADVPANKSQSVYTSEINTLKTKDGGAEVVFVWENALAAIEIIEQAAQQDYFPIWVVFPFNLMTETLSQNPRYSQVKMDGISAWAPYFPGVQNPVTKAYAPGKTDGSFAQYAALIKEYERQHNKYAPGENRDDIVFMTWGGWAQIHKLLLECGQDCTRNKIVGLLQSGVHKVDAPGCPSDFTKNFHVGGSSVNVFKNFTWDGRAGWDELRHCKTGF
jgi:ABC-type branched-subunit amino acid transport system substrate-binding protein